MKMHFSSMVLPSILTIGISAAFASTPVPALADNLQKPLVAAKSTVKSKSAVGSALAADPSCVNCFNKRYIYFGGNFTKAALGNDASYAKLIELIGRGKAAGYNGIVVNAGGSGSFAYLATGAVSQYFYANVAALVAYAKEKGMELIPVALSPDSITQIDSSLIEALPVKTRPFLVNGASAVSEGRDVVDNNSFENGATGWNLLDGITLDNANAHSGAFSVKFDEGKRQETMRLYREITNLQAFTAYRMSFWVKTSDFDAPLTVQIFDGNTVNPLYRNSSNNLGLGTTNGAWNANGNTLARTQDWKEYNIDFNTLGNGTVRIYLGTWHTGSRLGSAWVDDISVKEIGLAHTVRRTSLPVVVTSESGGTTYAEGGDYTVGTEKLNILSGSRIRQGDRLKVSWSQSARGVTNTWGAPASACYDAYFDKSKTIYNETYKLFNKTNGFLVYFDEWRVMNWDPACGSMSAGQYLANTVNRVENSMLAINPNAEIYIWNDMFDPTHNAKTSYWMDKGDLTNAWTGLNSKTIVMNWNEAPDQQVNSLKFFSGKSFKQMIALYYDDRTLAKTEKWLANLDLAQNAGVTGVDGFMFTTWAGDGGYDDLEKVANLIKTKYPQRWPN